MLVSIPITSPVECISGLKKISAPINLENGNTASFTVVYGGIISSVKPICDNVSPSIHLTAYLTKGSPIDLLTKGAVLDALGFASIIYT